MVYQIAQDACSSFIGNVTTNILPSISSSTVSSLANTALSSVTELSDQLGAPIGGLIAGAGLTIGAVFAYKEYNEVSELASDIIDQNMNLLVKTQIMLGIGMIPRNQRPDVFQRAQPFFNENMDGYEKYRIISAIANIPTNQRDDVMQKALPFFSENMDGYDIRLIISAIVNIPADQHDDVMQKAQPFFNENMNGPEKIEIIFAIAKIPPNQRDVIMQKALPLCNENMSGCEKDSIISAIHNIPGNECNDVMQKALLFFDESMCGYEKAQIISFIAKVQTKQRDDIIQKALPLSNGIMCGFTKARIISTIHNIPANQRDIVIHKAQLLFTENLDGHDKDLIISAIANILENERENRLNRALGQLQQDFPDGHFELNRILNLLQTPLNEAFPPLIGGMAAAAAAGLNFINVHDSSRDSKTKQAMTLLRNFKKMNDHEIDQAVNHCLSYLKSRSKEKALFVLDSPAKDTWGPLLPEKNCLWDAQNLTSGHEVIGRLWDFIQSIEDEKDKQCAIDSFIQALNNCVDSDGHRVCAPGKVERLFIGVLQGRLSGIIIDDSVPIPEQVKETFEGKGKEEADKPLRPTKEQAIDLFFLKPENQMIENLTELLQAAENFCKENENVDGQEFLEEIKEYAKVMDIE